jgi:hypothetical protein
MTESRKGGVNWLERKIEPFVMRRGYGLAHVQVWVLVVVVVHALIHVHVLSNALAHTLVHVLLTADVKGREGQEEIESGERTVFKQAFNTLP